MTFRSTHPVRRFVSARRGNDAKVMIKGTVALAVSKGTGMCNIGKAPKKRNMVDKSKGCPYVGPHVPSGKRDEGCSGHISYDITFISHTTSSVITSLWEALSEPYPRLSRCVVALGTYSQWALV